MRDAVKGSRYSARLGRIGGELKCAVMQQLSLSLSFFALVISELLYLIKIVRDRVRETAGVLKRYIGICGAQYYPAHRLSQHRIVNEAGVDEAAMMLEGVIARMVNAA